VKWPELWGRGAEFVDQEAVVFGEEEFDAEHADGVELFHDGSGDGNGFVSHGVADPSRGAGQVEDVVFVVVFDDTVVDKVAVGAAGGDHGDLAIEVDQLFEDTGLALGATPGFGPAEAE
jgi:hypothetical protein